MQCERTEEATTSQSGTKAHDSASTSLKNKYDMALMVKKELALCLSLKLHARTTSPSRHERT